MITEKIKALFSFIDFLHSNIGRFQKYNDLIKDLELLKVEKNKLNPESNYKDKLRFDTLQSELESKFENLQVNSANVIKVKAIELDICNFDNEPRYNFNGVQEEIQQLKKNFLSKDLVEIFKHKNKYIEYRNNTHKTYLSMSFFFEELDEITKSLFDYFKDTEQNEFESFETKTIIVDDLSDVITLQNKGQNNFFIPKINDINALSLSKSLNEINFFQIYYETDIGKEYNNSSIIKPENWDDLKDVFFSQRMELHKGSYTQNEKINLELESIENLVFNKTAYKILKNRYIEYLKNKHSITEVTQQFDNKPKKPKKNLSEFIHNIEDKEAFLQDLKNTFPTEIGKAIKGIIDLLKKDKYLIHNDREFSDVVNAIRVFFNRDIGSVQSIRDAKNTDDKFFIAPIEQKLNPLIMQHKTS